MRNRGGLRYADDGANRMTKPAGPFSSVVFGSIDGHLVRLNFLTEPATGMRAVLLVSNQDTLPDQSSAATFQEAIQNYEWAVAVDALTMG